MHNTKVEVLEKLTRNKLRNRAMHDLKLVSEILTASPKQKQKHKKRKKQKIYCAISWRTVVFCGEIWSPWRHKTINLGWEK